jgi:hypothetical protein
VGCCGIIGEQPEICLLFCPKNSGHGARREWKPVRPDSRICAAFPYKKGGFISLIVTAATAADRVKAAATLVLAPASVFGQDGQIQEGV